MAKEFKILINGEWLSTETELDVISPFDGEVIGMTYLAGSCEIEEAVASADRVAKELKAMPAYERANIIKKVASGLEARAEELARIIALEAGKPIKDARTEVARSINTFNIAAEEARRLGGEVIPLDTFPGSEKRTGIIRRFPVGPVLGISPFNFPLNLVAHKVAPAMACGCPLILKPASKTPLTSIILGEIVTEAGWPAGGLNVIPSSGKDIEKLMDDDRIKKLTFTGSPAIGWMLKNKAGQKRVTLELGGNAGLIIHDDADIEYAASRCVTGAFSYSGQICISIQRIYAHKKIFEKFKKLFIEKVNALKLGDPLDETTDVGPLIDKGSLKRTEEWVVEAIEGGAKVLAGGKSEGPFFQPTVLTDTTPSMKVCGNEVFAPVVTLEPYDNFEEAVEKGNHSLYGLQAGIFTNDIKRIFHAYEELDVGGLVVNDIPTFRVDNMPYGGVKMSGFGREGVSYAIDEMTEMKLLALNLK
jgi:acyl-CoA reductase-like NAD-dependent aldehyde dehydrogenase